MLPALVVRPAVVPHEKLDEIEVAQTKVSQALLDMLTDVIRRVGVVEAVRGLAGHFQFLGGTLVAAYSRVSGCERTSSPSSCSLRPSVHPIDDGLGVFIQRTVHQRPRPNLRLFFWFRSG